MAPTFMNADARGVWRDCLDSCFPRVDDLIVAPCRGDRPAVAILSPARRRSLPRGVTTGQHGSSLGCLTGSQIKYGLCQGRAGQERLTSKLTGITSQGRPPLGACVLKVVDTPRDVWRKKVGRSSPLGGFGAYRWSSRPDRV
jgi:hypothetical protein